MQNDIVVKSPPNTQMSQAQPAGVHLQPGTQPSMQPARAAQATPARPQAAPQQQAAPAQAANPQSKSKKPVGAIFFAILICGCLIAAAIYMNLKKTNPEL
jgi:hypothetical protein